MPAYHYETQPVTSPQYVIKGGDRPILTLSSGEILEFPSNFQFLTKDGWKDSTELLVGEIVWNFQQKNESSHLNRQKQRIIDAVLASGDFVMIERIAKILNVKEKPCAKNPNPKTPNG